MDDTEMVVKKMIREKLGIEEDMKIERAHRVGKKFKASSQSRKFEFNVFNILHLNGHN